MGIGPEKLKKEDLVNMKKLFIATISFFVLSFNMNAQELEIGFFGGGSYYLGDINPGKHFMQTKPAFGALVRYDFNTRLSARLIAYRGKLQADDEVIKFNTERDLHFQSNITDITAQFEFNFLPYFTGSKMNYVSTYIFGGASVFFFKPKADGVDLRDAGTEGQLVNFDGRNKYNLVGFAIPFGIGVKYSLTKKIGVGFEWGIRKTFTDYLDDISTTYYLNGPDIDPANINEVLSDPSRSKLPEMQRGDPRTKDWYSFAGIYITYKIDLGGRAKCLEHQGYGSY